MRLSLVRGFLLAFIGISLVVSIAALVEHALAKRGLCEGCNVVLISIDTLGAKHTSVHNPSLDTTPFLQALADERGIVFERAYAQAPWTLPSHTAMLTGLYPWDVGVWEARDALPESVDTVAEYFEREGYNTALFSNGAFVQPQWNFDQGFDETSGSLEEHDWNDLPQLLRTASAWMVSREEVKEPFFVMVRPFHVHDPYGEHGQSDSVTIVDIAAINQKPGGPTEEDAERLRARYHDEIRVTDAALREFFTQLDAQGLAENTVVIVTSDHGEEFGEHGTVSIHSVTTYDENIHVPLIVFLPDAKPQRIPYSVEVRSIAATLRDIAGDRGASEAGRAPSLVALISGDETADRLAHSRTKVERDSFLSSVENGYPQLASATSSMDISERSTPYGGPYAAALIEGRWKVIMQLDGTKEVYDLVTDPNEQNNLYSSLHTLSSVDRLTVHMLLFRL